EPRRTNRFHAELAGGAPSGVCRSRRGSICGTRRGIRNRNRFQGVQDKSAALAAVNFFVGFRGHFLKNVRKDAHAAAAALAVAGFGHGRAVVSFGDARVQFAQIFRHRRDDFFALGGGGLQLFLFFRALGLNFFSLRGDGLLRFFQSRLRDFHAAFGFFRRHHHFQLAVFGLGHFGFGVGDFVLQCLKSFVGFYRPALIAVFPRAVFPLLHVKFELHAFRDDLRVCLFRGSDIGACAAEFGFRFADAFWKRFQFR